MSKKKALITGDWLYEQYWNQEKSTREIDKEFGFSNGTTLRKMTKFSIPRRSNANYGSKNGAWKGGKTISNGYYVVICRNHPRSDSNGYVYEHIIIAEEMLGRYITKKERIHHIDGDKLNNSKENLYVFNNDKEHQNCHKQFDEVLYELYKIGIIKFKKGKYCYE